MFAIKVFIDIFVLVISTMKNSILFSLFIFCSTFSFTQEEHDHGTHDHHKNEIGVANMPAYFFAQEKIYYAIHLHYVRKIKESKFGLGLAYEKIFDPNNHHTFSAVVAYNPVGNWVVNLSPGMTIEGANREQRFSIHGETSYEFELGEHFHIGPLLELAYDIEDWHLSLGLHIGFGF